MSRHDTGFKRACGGCHGTPPTSFTFVADYGLIGTPRPSNALSGISEGAHKKHTDPPHDLVCDTCHYISNTTAIKMPSLSNTIDMGFFGFGGKVTSGTYIPYSSASPRPGYKFKSGTPNTTIASVATTYTAANKCLNVYCHGGGVKVGAIQTKNPLAGGSNTTPQWDVLGLVQCGTCHGVDPNNPPDMGSHKKHVGNACISCHPAIDMGHVVGSVRWQISPSFDRGGSATYRNVASGTVGYSNELAPSDTYGTCTNFSCHNNGKGGNPRIDAQWGSSSFGTNCDGCHGGNSAAGAPLSTDMHDEHVTNS